MRNKSISLKNVNNFKLVGDEDGLRVSNYPKVAKYVADRLKESVEPIGLLEVCCGIGGTTIELAKVFPKVYAVDINSERIEFARKNILAAGLSNNVEFFAEDIFSSNLLNQLLSKEINVIYTDVEWTTSGIYGQDHAKDVEKTTPNTSELFYFLRKNFCENICMRLPENVSKKQLRDLARCEIEEISKNGEVKFIYVYFGKLIRKSSSKTDFKL